MSLSLIVLGLGSTFDLLSLPGIVRVLASRCSEFLRVEARKIWSSRHDDLSQG